MSKCEVLSLEQARKEFRPMSSSNLSLDYFPIIKIVLTRTGTNSAKDIYETSTTVSYKGKWEMNEKKIVHGYLTTDASTNIIKLVALNIRSVPNDTWYSTYYCNVLQNNEAQQSRLKKQKCSDDASFF